ncbi:hypothetical protein SAMN05444377_10823 [Flavobacterium fontis]|uniref:Uncharacterized protein n=1 Tax=Flavobacterium fontis TaxID=1124188 RepID=A0A1M5BD49_9FLAO|nr:hypothetical protein [Flavobacterium fontis]SHF40082.1 hypothetical protein SAMN05444377_10823 [Flavobacterium fontis]
MKEIISLIAPLIGVVLGIVIKLSKNENHTSTPLRKVFLLCTMLSIPKAIGMRSGGN